MVAGELLKAPEAVLRKVVRLEQCTSPNGFFLPDIQVDISLHHRCFLCSSAFFRRLGGEKNQYRSGCAENALIYLHSGSIFSR